MGGFYNLSNDEMADPADEQVFFTAVIPKRADAEGPRNDRSISCNLKMFHAVWRLHIFRLRWRGSFVVRSLAVAPPPKRFGAQEAARLPMTCFIPR